MTIVLHEIFRILSPGGRLALLFNARDNGSWAYVRESVQHTTDVDFEGCFPLVYSAGSVVQDNRAGSLKNDYVLIYKKHADNHTQDQPTDPFMDIEGWSTSFPTIHED
jgi:hypothetical protein